MADLVKSSAGSLQRRVEVDVLTKANPLSSVLRQTRVAVQNSPSIRALFIQSKEEGWAATRLATEMTVALEAAFPGEHPEVAEAATFLADEYQQLGDSILLISADTGRALAKITEADFYQPAPVPRESGNMVVPARRLRPELEGFIVQWVFDRASDNKQAEAFLATLPQTQLLREQGDPRVLFSTREGRQTIGSQIKEHLPSLLPTYCGGSPRSLFNFLKIGAPPPEGFVSLGKFPSYGTASFPLLDRKTRNLRHDVLAASLATTATGWARGLALHLLLSAKDHSGPAVSLADLRRMADEARLWISSANASIALQRTGTKADVFTVFSIDTLLLGVSEPFGYLDIDPTSYESKTREIFGRWEAVSSFQATLWVDWAKIRVVSLQAVPSTGHITEVV